MFTLFKKKQPPTPSRPPAILVPEAAVAVDAETHALTTAVVDYVNRMMNDALYRRDEIPQEAMWIYHADYYLAEVNNGGHSQFIRNSGMSDFITSDIRSALRLVGAREMAACFDEMICWVSANPTEAATQNGFSQRAEELDALDQRFFALGDDKFYPKVNAWLASSGLLKPLPATALRESFEDEARHNPHFAKRARIQRINRLQHTLTADFLGLFQVAGAKMLTKEGILEIQRLTAGTPMGHPTEDDGIIWGVATNSGVLAGYVTESTVVLAEPGRENGFSAGKILFECARTPAQEVVDYSASMLSAACAVELLSRVNREARFRHLAPAMQELGRDKKNRPHMAYIGVTETGQTYQIVITEGHATIGPLNFTEPMANIFGRGMTRLRTEVEAHNSYQPTR